ncbi:MAG TPA: YfiR family protein [Burkholderiales bacterium]|nr:YfiR family protein [Burkholderiales bacterium]
MSPPLARLAARLAGLLLALAATAAAPAAQAETAPAIQVKAAYLYQFGGFVEWPPQSFPSADSAFVIGLIGADDVAAELERIVASRSVHGRRVEVRRLRAGDPLGGVHVLFVGLEETRRIGQILAAADERPLLVVTDAPGMPPGSAINFTTVDNKLRFDVDLAAAQRRQLKISSRLLGVARKVLPGRG